MPAHGACFLCDRQVSHVALGHRRASGTLKRLECLFGRTRMWLFKYLLLLSGAGLVGGAFAIVVYGIYRTRESWRQY
jgi:hypothetical protein